MPRSTESRPRARARADAGVPVLATIAAGAAVALVPRLFHLGSKGIWMDEAYGVNLVRLPLGEMIAQLRI